MTVLQLNAELYRAMGEIADDENLLKKVLKYVKKLTAQKPDSTLMSREEFFARVDEGREQIKQGKCTRFSNREAMNAWLNSL